MSWSTLFAVAGGLFVVAAIFATWLAVRQALSVETGSKTPPSPKLRRGAYWR